MARAEERCRTEARTAPSLEGTRCIEGFVVAASDAVDRPEAAVADPVWTGRGKIEGLRLADVLRRQLRALAGRARAAEACCGGGRLVLAAARRGRGGPLADGPVPRQPEQFDQDAPWLLGGLPTSGGMYAAIE
jgi:hypothetical protein